MVLVLMEQSRVMVETLEPCPMEDLMFQRPPMLLPLQGLIRQIPVSLRQFQWVTFCRSCMSRTNLPQNIASCGSAIQGVTADLEAAVEVFHRGSETIKSGLTAVADQIGKQTSAVTTMSGGLMYETTEISKLLKAFDRFSNTTQWFMKAKQPLETNIHDVKMEIGALNSKMEATMGRGFEFTGKLLKDLIKVNERIVTLLESQSGSPGGTTGGTPIGTGMVAPASAAAVPPFPLPTPPPLPANTGNTSGVAGSPPGTPGAGTASSGQPLPTSLFLAYCPETPGGQRPSYSGWSSYSMPTCRDTDKRRWNQSAAYTVSPTGYRSNEISGLTSLWAPNGLATIRDGQQLVRRIYWPCWPGWHCE